SENEPFLKKYGAWQETGWYKVSGIKDLVALKRMVSAIKEGFGGKLDPLTGKVARYNSEKDIEFTAWGRVPVSKNNFIATGTTNSQNIKEMVRIYENIVVFRNTLKTDPRAEELFASIYKDINLHNLVAGDLAKLCKRGIIYDLSGRRPKTPQEAEKEADFYIDLEKFIRNLTPSGKKIFKNIHKIDLDNIKPGDISRLHTIIHPERSIFKTARSERAPPAENNSSSEPAFLSEIEKSTYSEEIKSLIKEIYSMDLGRFSREDLKKLQRDILGNPQKEEALPEFVKLRLTLDGKIPLPSLRMAIIRWCMFNGYTGRREVFIISGGSRESFYFLVEGKEDLKPSIEVIKKGEIIKEGTKKVKLDKDITVTFDDIFTGRSKFSYQGRKFCKVKQYNLNIPILIIYSPAQEPQKKGAHFIYSEKEFPNLGLDEIWNPLEKIIFKNGLILELPKGTSVSWVYSGSYEGDRYVCKDENDCEIYDEGKVLVPAVCEWAKLDKNALKVSYEGKVFALKRDTRIVAAKEEEMDINALRNRVDSYLDSLNPEDYKEWQDFIEEVKQFSIKAYRYKLRENNVLRNIYGNVAQALEKARVDQEKKFYAEYLILQSQSDRISRIAYIAHQQEEAEQNLTDAQKRYDEELQDVRDKIDFYIQKIFENKDNPGLMDYYRELRDQAIQHEEMLVNMD
ncbi:MAG: hypothetical protein DRQ02_13285, partial [Candidatus Latescibacterota bacterium]